MLLIICIISIYIHIYTLSYMIGDTHYNQFYITIELFAFSINILIMSNNIIMLFLSWELVGICSYFLISFWKLNQFNNLSSIKALLFNKIGDIFILFLILILLFYYFILNYNNILLLINNKWLNIISSSLLIASFTKSTILPFSGWISDAMAAPTPVSALLHSATMVTAGIFLLFKFYFIFISIPFLSSFTLIFASIIAVYQSNMKKIIAYSTTSQLSYMCWSCALCNYISSLFHLFIHAFFKSLLFLISGIILHLLINELNIYKLGGFNNILSLEYNFLFLSLISLISW